MKVLILICSLVIISIWLLWKYKWELIIVSGASMYPTLKDGDIMLVDKNPKEYNIKDIVVLDDPEIFDELIVKRIENKYTGLTGENRIWLLGDNRDNSLDSRQFGWIKESNLTGKVIKTWKRTK